MKPIKIMQDYKCKINIADYDYACLMIGVKPISIITEIQNQIDKSDINTEHGLETEQHVTVVYGIDILTHLSKFFNIIPSDIGRLKLGKLGIFDTNENYDVLKISVVPSEELLKLRKTILDTLPVTLTYTDYNPHITIGYLKKDTGKKYLEKFKDMDFSIELLKFSKYRYSSRNQNETFTVA